MSIRAWSDLGFGMCVTHASPQLYATVEVYAVVPSILRREAPDNSCPAITAVDPRVTCVKFAIVDGVVCAAVSSTLVEDM